MESDITCPRRRQLSYFRAIASPCPSQVKSSQVRSRPTRSNHATLQRRNPNVPRNGPRSIPKPPALSTHRLPRYAHPHTSTYTQQTHSQPPIGDTNVLSAARAEARKNFEQNRSLPAGSTELTAQITHAQEVAKFLRENVVQGQATDEQGNYSMCFLVSTFLAWSRHLRHEILALDRLSNLFSTGLRIHEQTERGDNEDIKKAKGKRTLGGGGGPVKCCSS